MPHASPDFGHGNADGLQARGAVAIHGYTGHGLAQNPYRNHPADLQSLLPFRVGAADDAIVHHGRIELRGILKDVLNDIYRQVGGRDGTGAVVGDKKAEGYQKKPKEEETPEQKEERKRKREERNKEEVLVYDESLVGRRVRCLWEAYGEWFVGTLIEYRPPQRETRSEAEQGRYLVRYDDQTEEEVGLPDNTVKVLPKDAEKLPELTTPLPRASNRLVTGSVIGVTPQEVKVQKTHGDGAVMTSIKSDASGKPPGW